MSDEAPLPPLSPELASKLWRAVSRVMDKDTRDRLLIAGVDLDDAGPYAVAELRAMDRRHRWQLRLWRCRSSPTPPQDMGWMSFRKYFGRVLPDDTVIDAAGQRYADLYDWLFSLALLGPDLPDFPHAGPAREAMGRDSQDHRTSAFA
jgi:hypothetical protein